jgi:hypothetical protein
MARVTDLTPPPPRRRWAPPPDMILVWLRRGLVVAVVITAAVVLATGHGRVCSDAVTNAGAVVRTCRTPSIGDGEVLVFGLLVLLLMLPDLSEFGVPGLITLRRRVSEQESALGTEREYRELLAAEIDTIQASIAQASAASQSGAVGVLVMNPNQTADLAAGERPPLAPTAAVTQARYNAAETLMRRLRADPGPQLVGCSLHLYLPDEEQRLLVTALEHDADRSLFGREGWAVGQGIVGRVWRDGDAIVARGRDILTALDDLADTHREPYLDLAVLVAVPVVNANDRTVGVLTAHATDSATRLDSPEGLAQLLALAEVLARVLVDLLGWTTDLP